MPRYRAVAGYMNNGSWTPQQNIPFTSQEEADRDAEEAGSAAAQASATAAAILSGKATLLNQLGIVYSAKLIDANVLDAITFRAAYAAQKVSIAALTTLAQIQAFVIT